MMHTWPLVEETKQVDNRKYDSCTSIFNFLYISGSVKIGTNDNITCTFQETPHCHQYPWQKSHRWIWHFASLSPEHTAEEE